jgi:hypothetical protein
MQPVSPYRFSGRLGHCHVGSVWSAADEVGRPLTVAVLDDAAARDQRWRDAFAEAVEELAQPGTDRPHQVRAEVSAEVPWAAYAGAGGSGVGAERVFESLGMQVVATDPAAAAPISGPNGAGVAPTSGPSGVVSAPTSGPSGAWPVVPAQSTWTSSDPISGQPYPSAPYSPAAPHSPAAPDSYGLGYPSPAGQDPFAGPTRRIVPTERPQRRRGLWLGIAAVVVVFLAAGGVVFALVGGGGGKPGPATESAAAPQQAALPTAAPASPGIEPPKGGTWPANWPRFKPTESVRTLTLDGFGFPVKVPPTWQCTLAGRAAGFVRYTCGTPPGEATQFGGELVVRSCAAPCDENHQAELRRGEEAWGAQWIRSSPYGAYAEQIIEADGEQRHGLVVVAFWRGASGEIDHQLVFRMTGPVHEAPQLRKVATYLRDTLVF